MDTWQRRDWAWLVALVAAFTVLALWDLHRVAEPVFDEVYTLPAARAIAAGLPSMEQTHPPISKLCMALAVKLAGAQDWVAIAYASRVASVLVGALGLMAMAGLAWLATGRRAVALLATALLAADGTYFVFSRTAMTNIYGVALALVGAFGVLLAVRRQDMRWLVPAGIAFGLAVASRWSAALGLGVTVAALAWYRPRWAAVLVVVPVATYALTFVGSGDLLAAQQFMVSSHTRQLDPNPFNSPWWSWPLLLRPTWLIFGAIPARDEVWGILAIGNPWIWWLAVPALGWACLQREPALRVAGTWGLVAWLVWAPGASNYRFAHYFFEAVPMACLALAALLVRLDRKLLTAGYAVLVAAWLVQFYPLLVGRPLAVPAYASRLWLGIPRWDFAYRMNEFHRELGLDTPAKVRAYERKNSPTLDEYVKSVGEQAR